ncbi:hypothetical protein SNE40_018179 [Patella caerulea]
MIGCSASKVRTEVVKSVQNACYCAICLDTTTDASRQDQLSVIVRYVNPAGGINEELLDMVNANDMTAEGLFSTVKDTLDKYQLDIQNIRGQGYDGCSTMAGFWSSDEDARIDTVCPFYPLFRSST